MILLRLEMIQKKLHSFFYFMGYSSTIKSLAGYNKSGY